MSRFRFLLDTNVIVDFLAFREPFFKQASLLMTCGRVGEFELWMTSSQVTDAIYILSMGGKPSLVPETLAQMRNLRTFVDVHATSVLEVDRMLASGWEDPEDSLLYEAALSLDVDAIVTRNAKDFEASRIKAIDCDELFDWLKKECGLVYDEVSI